MYLRKMILFTYYVQAGHCLFSAFHMWMAIDSSFITGFINGVLAGLNCLAFMSAANWRYGLQDQARLQELHRRLWRRDP